MRRSERRAAAGLAVTLASLVVLALAPAGAQAASPLAPEGDSHLAAAFGRARVEVDLTAHAQAIARLAIHVDGVALDVPPQAWSDLPGAATADLARREDGRFVLHLEGGAAVATTAATGAAPWVAEIVFDRLGLRGRRLVDAATGQVRQDLDWGAPELLD